MMTMITKDMVNYISDWSRENGICWEILLNGQTDGATFKFVKAIRNKNGELGAYQVKRLIPFSYLTEPRTPEIIIEAMLEEVLNQFGKVERGED